MISDFQLPKRFKIGNQWWSVYIVDKLESNNYGEFNDAKSSITIAKSINSHTGVIDLTPEQIHNSFVHELIHVFNWMWNTETNECLAQSFANFIREYCSTSNMNITYIDGHNVTANTF